MAVRFQARMLVNPEKISYEEYWSIICGDCRLSRRELSDNGTRKCASCFIEYSKKRREGKVFYLTRT